MDLVAKLLDWEDASLSLDGTAALVADNPDAAGDFEANAREGIAVDWPIRYADLAVKWGSSAREAAAFQLR